MNNVFWVIWNERANAPTVKHWSYQSAKNEAERLARCNPGQEFHVLKSFATCKSVDVAWTNHEDERPW